MAMGDDTVATSRTAFVAFDVALLARSAAVAGFPVGSAHSRCEGGLYGLFPNGLRDADKTYVAGVVVLR